LPAHRHHRPISLQNVVIDTFSENTFHLDYRTHHRLDYRRIFSSVNSASGIRDMAREFKVSDKVILNRISRLARQSHGRRSVSACKGASDR
jgi:hypothetical protein